MNAMPTPGVTRRRFSLFWRLTGAIALVLLAGAGALTFAAFSYARTAADGAYDRLLIGAARQIADTVSAEGGTITVDVPISALETLSISRTDRVYYQITAPDGAIVTGYEALPVASPAIQAGDAAHVSDARFLDQDIRLASVWRYIAEQGATGWVRISVAQTREARNVLTLELTLGALLPVLAMSLLALVVLMAAVRIGLAPLRRVERALQRRDPNDLTPLEGETPIEVEALIVAINRFMGRLSDRLGAMQRYIETAAHQLRTPLTGIAAQVEMLDRARDDKARDMATARLRKRTTEVGRLANQLLSHATVLHRAEVMLADRIDLRQLAEQAVVDANIDLAAKDLSVRKALPESPVWVRGDLVALREAVRNLVENAVHHGAQSRVTITVETAEEGPMLAVHDDGPGISPGDWDHLLIRFVSGKWGHTGLGLAIVSDVARAHGARLGIRHAPDGDFGIALMFPADGACP
ncbi:sensor histidine kinase [Pelagibacterium montanilacus]|uniref:sensor histidine kinase n=1 Tax=Pelagibacterium montanilacus TaxID=2185280 RepID=UPI000F8F35A6|nr:sensor histidine kinase [Pelagibacterium montanilacus]